MSPVVGIPFSGGNRITGIIDYTFIHFHFSIFNPENKNIETYKSNIYNIYMNNICIYISALDVS